LLELVKHSKLHTIVYKKHRFLGVLEVPQGFFEYNRVAYTKFDRERTINLLFVSNIHCSSTMPSKKNSISSPVKSAVNEDMLDWMWCVTDRLGLYVQLYNNDPPVKGKEANDVLSRIGFINSVSWSGVYAKDGQNVNVFKFEVETKGSDGVNQTGEGQIKTYVVGEENFTDFSCEHYRQNYLKDGETGCANVDQDLIDAWCATNKSKNGMWLKRWFNNIRGDEPNASAQAVRTQSRMPGVFGEDSRANQNSQANATTNQDKDNEESAAPVLPAPGKSPSLPRSGSNCAIISVLLCVLYV
jgi:hypothetical protein